MPRQGLTRSMAFIRGPYVREAGFEVYDCARMESRGGRGQPWQAVLTEQIPWPLF